MIFFHNPNSEGSEKSDVSDVLFLPLNSLPVFRAKKKDLMSEKSEKSDLSLLRIDNALFSRNKSDGIFWCHTSKILLVFVFAGVDFRKIHTSKPPNPHQQNQKTPAKQ